MINPFKFEPPNKTYPFKIKKGNPTPVEQYEQKTEISNKVSENLTDLKNMTHADINSDIVFRNFILTVNNVEYPSFLCFYDGLTDSALMDEFILRPLMNTYTYPEKDIAFCITNYILEQNQITQITTWQKAIDSLVVGNCLLFIDTLALTFSCDIKKLPTRSINKSENESSVNGPSESFVEGLRQNTGLLRKYVKDKDLVFEDIPVGQCGKTTCSIAYISSIANDSLVAEIKRRISSIEADFLLDSGQLSQFIEDKTYLTEPLILNTERPDRVASHLFEGRVAVLVSGSPNALIMPAVLSDFLHSSEDNYLRFPYSTFLRFFRGLALFLSVLLPGLYIAVVTFHQEMIPTDLLFAIASAREKVPLPLFLELLLMEFAFDIIREASLKTPSPMGQTLGIVGTLILGQAIVSANIVSPILIIIVAMTGISSFAVSNFSLNYTFRILRYLYLFLGIFGGFFAISIGLFIHLLMLCVTTSYGAPYLAPLAPLGKNYAKNDMSSTPIWKQEYRPSFLRTKRKKRQPHISRAWMQNQNKNSKN